MSFYEFIRRIFVPFGIGLWEAAHLRKILLMIIVLICLIAPVPVQAESPLQRDALSIVDKPLEWGIVYDAPGTTRIVVPGDSKTDIDIDAYNEVLRNGGVFIHNHPLGCPTVSQADVLVAAVLNLKQMTAVSRNYGRMTIVSVIRTAPKWNLKNISLRAVKTAYAQTSGDVCQRWHRTWQILCPAFGCVVKSEGY